MTPVEQPVVNILSNFEIFHAILKCASHPSIVLSSAHRKNTYFSQIAVEYYFSLLSISMIFIENVPCVSYQYKRLVENVLYFADGMFRELDKVDTDISASWLKAALLVSYISIVVTSILGTVYFGGYLNIYYAPKLLRLLMFHSTPLKLASVFNEFIFNIWRINYRYTVSRICLKLQKISGFGQSTRAVE